MLILPFIPSVAAYEFSTDIEGISYTFDVRWNSRDEGWYFNLFEDNGAPIAYGLKVVLGTLIGETTPHNLFRLGVLVVIDTTQEGREATFDDLGTRVQVRYVPVAEYLARVAGSGAPL